MTLLLSEPVLADGFRELLKAWRQQRRLSQLDLALTCGVSQRHVSFLESGRARPSRNMILRLSETLDVPLRDRNHLLTAAGFAPIFKARSLDDPQMNQVMAAVQMMLANHAPFPALAIDRAWNIVLTNEPFERLARIIGDDVWDRVGSDRRNLMRLFFHAEGIRSFVTNWSEISPLLWLRAQREADALGGQDMRDILQALRGHQDQATLNGALGSGLVPILPLKICKDGLVLSLFTVIATFGTAQDITADELRVESLFPADEATDKLLRGFA